MARGEQFTTPTPNEVTSFSRHVREPCLWSTCRTQARHSRYSKAGMRAACLNEKYPSLTAASQRSPRLARPLRAGWASRRCPLPGSPARRGDGGWPYSRERRGRAASSIQQSVRRGTELPSLPSPLLPLHVDAELGDPCVAGPGPVGARAGKSNHLPVPLHDDERVLPVEPALYVLDRPGLGLAGTAAVLNPLVVDGGDGGRVLKGGRPSGKLLNSCHAQ